MNAQTLGVFLKPNIKCGSLEIAKYHYKLITISSIHIDVVCDQNSKSHDKNHMTETSRDSLYNASSKHS